VANSDYQEDYCRCQKRFWAEEYDQHDGGSAQLIRVRSDTSGSEVGSEGKLELSALCQVAGTWKDSLTTSSISEQLPDC